MNELERLKQLYPYQFTRVIAYGMSVEPGWMTIFSETCSAIDSVLTGHRKQNFSWRQVKEKLGGLRLYWDRRWSEIDTCPYDRDRWEYLEEYVFPETIPEDPAFDPAKQTIEQYIGSERSQEWNRLHQIPNPARANLPRRMERRIGDFATLTFDDEDATEEDINLAAAAAARELLLPETVTDRIRVIVENAAKHATTICQLCGEPGSHANIRGWLAIACEKHRDYDSFVAERARSAD
ncbi:MAG: hypothetical protein IPO38_00400 [Rhodocyclaceae bacterium]|nr:hypothetical protein [Rhodocyclaceae bacterium]MBP6108678.1 hypothetical protein [Rhodocyclaceae bacterium]